MWPNSACFVVLMEHPRKEGLSTSIPPFLSLVQNHCPSFGDMKSQADLNPQTGWGLRGDISLNDDDLLAEECECGGCCIKMMNNLKSLLGLLLIRPSVYIEKTRFCCQGTFKWYSRWKKLLVFVGWRKFLRRILKIVVREIVKKLEQVIWRAWNNRPGAVEKQFYMFLEKTISNVLCIQILNRTSVCLSLDLQ